MKLENALGIFISLKNQTGKRSETKVYDQFIHLIIQLQNRALSTTELQLLETEFDGLDLGSKEKRKRNFFKKELSKFETFLIENLELQSKGYYFKRGSALGISFGMLFGVIALSSFERSLGVSYGLLIGMVIGATIGKAMDVKAEKAGRVL